MADYNKVLAVQDGNIAYTENAAAASATIPIYKDEKLAVIVNNASAGAVTATVKAGDGIRSVLGDLSVSVPAGAKMLIGPFDSMRFGSGGKLTVTTSSQASVTVGVIQLP